MPSLGQSNKEVSYSLDIFSIFYKATSRPCPRVTPMSPVRFLHEEAVLDAIYRPSNYLLMPSHKTCGAYPA